MPLDAAGNRLNGALAVLLRQQNVSVSTPLAVHNAILVPNFLYGSETLENRLQNKNERKTNAVLMWSLRSAVLADRIRNKEIHRIVGISEDVCSC